MVLIGMTITAVFTFIQIQLWMHNPRRRQLNEEWFKQWENYRRSRYNTREMLDSIEGFSEHFHRESRHIG
jgi:hypothetical protein